MVLAQPHLTLTPHEPYRCTDQSRPRHLEAISAAIAVARNASHGAEKTHFTVFPEYSIPYPDGIELVERNLLQGEWPNQTIVIGGTDGLSTAEYSSLAAAPNTHVEVDPATVPPDQWLNCGIIWTKAGDGTVERWLQPKLCPSWLEQNVVDRTMHRGSSVFVFSGEYDSGAQYRFAVMVCFDWIATVEGTKTWRAIIDELSQRSTDIKAEISLSWWFVIQHNRRPSDESFMAEVNDFFDQTIATNVRRDRTCLVFANSAGRPQPGKVHHYGNSSVIFAQQTLFRMPRCHATFCTGGYRFRGHRVIRHHKDFLFREGGSCVHSFEQLNPDSIVPGAPGSAIALRNPFVHPLGCHTDPRIPAGVVSASVKWLNDELDTIESFAHRCDDAPLAATVRTTCEHVMTGLRSIPGDRVDGAVTLACPATPPDESDTVDLEAATADEWGDVERDAIVHLVDTVSIVALFSDHYSVAETARHATMSIRELNFDVVAVRGKTHPICLEHYAEVLPRGRWPVLLVSRDPDNNEWTPRFGSYLESPDRGYQSQRDFTQPPSVAWHVGYKNLLDIFRESTTVEQAQEAFNEKLCQ